MVKAIDLKSIGFSRAGSNPVADEKVSFLLHSVTFYMVQKNMENPGFDPGASTLLTSRSSD